VTAYQPIDDASSEAPPAPTTLGRYQLLGKLATGGMGEIHLARLDGDGGFERVVVVKRLLPELVASEHFVAMFLDEARIAARLSHPNVCEVHELGRDGHDYYLAMPYLEGVSVADLIARPRDSDRELAVRLVAGVIAQAAEGLHHAHELHGKDGESLGLVHRDVSPSNLMVTTAGVVKVLDFGIAKVRGATARTEVGTIKGKYAYMSPEQVRGDELDRRSDVFALGVVAFELATHQRLFRRASDFLSAKAILEEPIAREDAVDPSVPKEIADVIARALDRDRDARYATARELGAAMAAAAKASGGALDAAEIAGVIAAEHALELSEQRTRQQRVIAAHKEATTIALRPKRRKRRGWAIPGAAAMLAIAGIAMIGWPRPSVRFPSVSGSAPAPAPAPAPARESEAVAESEPVITYRSVEPVAVDGQGQGQGQGQGSEKKRNGYLSIDSTPYATVYLDGDRLGVTPMIRRSVPSGRHRLRVVLEDGRSRKLTVDIPAGKLAQPLNLTW
jgi:serine/threonine-protein kinase